jgi:hypothetical protein
MLDEKHGAQMDLTDRQLEDKIEDLIRRKWPRLHLTEEDLAEWICGDSAYQRDVNRACRRLLEEERLKREGGGVAYHPYTYRPWKKPTFKFNRKV